MRTINRASSRLSLSLLAAVVAGFLFLGLLRIREQEAKDVVLVRVSKTDDEGRIHPSRAKTWEKDPEIEDLVLNPLLDPLPQRDFARYAHLPPLNHEEKSKYAFATLLCTRKSNIHDPYFAATQSLVYRLLWSSYASKYPFVVFVCPFTPKSQRDILLGQGAFVRELPLLNDVVPFEKLEVARWADQFTKLNMWNATEFKKIVFMDSDVFPVKNLDHYFEVSEDRLCKADRLMHSGSITKELSAEDVSSICRYSFAAVDWYGVKEINGGMFIFNPNQQMHTRLLEFARHPESFDSSRMEQGLLSAAFAAETPFPIQWLDMAFNPSNLWVEDPGNANRSMVVHQKLWVPLIVDSHPTLRHMWDLGWMTLCRFYDSQIFVDARESGRRKSALELYSDAVARAKKGP